MVVLIVKKEGLDLIDGCNVYGKHDHMEPDTCTRHPRARTRMPHSAHAQVQNYMTAKGIMFVVCVCVGGGGGGGGGGAVNDNNVYGM